ncbi:MAG: DUF3127 domain-containing protein [Bacteroidota bacterium]
MSLSVQGTLHVVLDTQQVTPSFRKREFVIKVADNPAYPQFVKFELIQDRCELIEGYNSGDLVEVSFNLRGREWNSPQGETKYFTTLDAWRLNPVRNEQNMGGNQMAAGGTPTGAPSAGNTPQNANTGAVDVTTMQDDDDLPF